MQLVFMYYALFQRGNDKMKHYISVALCTYNGEKYIKQQLESIIDQTELVNEIIIGDDGSTDKTIQIAKEVLEDAKIDYKIICNTVNLGFCKNFENVISHTKGDIIFLSDQDDVWESDKVEVMIRDFDHNENSLVIFSNANLVNENMERLPGTLWDAVYYTEKENKKSEWFELLLSGNYMTGAAMAFRRSLFEQTKPFPKNVYHDEWLAVHAALYGDIEKEERKLINYRQHGKNVCGAVVHHTILDKFKYKKNIINNLLVTQQNDHKARYQFWQEVYRSIVEKEVYDKELKKIEKCMEFHGEFLKNHSKWKLVGFTLKAMAMGEYGKFVKKPVGCFVGDLLYSIIK